MPRLTPETVKAVKSLLWNGFAAIVAALLAASLAWYVTASTNAEMTIQQQEMTAINQFDESGAQLDSSMSDFMDSIADGQVAPEVRKSLRTAISLHAAKSQRLSTLIGAKPVEDYTLGLGRLRAMADATEDIPSGMQAAQMHADILLNKSRMSEASWRRITAQ